MGRHFGKALYFGFGVFGQPNQFVDDPLGYGYVQSVELGGRAGCKPNP
jgi:hypothetical protein